MRSPRPFRRRAAAGAAEPPVLSPQPRPFRVQAQRDEPDGPAPGPLDVYLSRRQMAQGTVAPPATPAPAAGTVQTGAIQTTPADPDAVQREPDALYDEALQQKETFTVEEPLEDFAEDGEGEAAGPEEHSIYPELLDGELQLMVASDPRVLAEFLLHANLDGASKEKLRLIATQLNDVLTGWKANLGRALGRILENIAHLLENARTGAVQLPRTNATWPTTGRIRIRKTSVTNEYDAGLDMVADPLSIRPGGTHGAQPASEGLGSNLIWGHLLNHKLHGPNAHSNLVPISRNLNGKMESDIEDPVKQAVLGENKVVRYRVRVLETDNTPSVSLLATKLGFEVKELGWHAPSNSWQPLGTQPPELADIDGTTLQRKEDPNAEIEQEEPLQIGEEEHHLFIEVRDGVPHLMIASDPLLLIDYFNTGDGRNLDKKTLQKAVMLSNLYDDIVSGYTADLGKAVAQLLRAAAGILKNASRGALSLPKTKVAWSTKKANVFENEYTMGKKMIASPLSIVPGDTVGSEPTEETIRAGFVWGHLLNHKLHGPAELYNLMPITGSLNQKMERRVESVAKNAVLGKNQVIEYGIEVIESSSVDDIDWVPTKLKVTMKEMRPRRRLTGETVWGVTSRQDPALAAVDDTTVSDSSSIIDDLDEFRA